jgi:2-polyprenyl-3-methyl-5-hydroxy-6-metoxy-1,4-benzoquinol methylase
MNTKDNATISAAIKCVSDSLIHLGDEKYFAAHAERFRHCASTICKNSKPDERILDVGGHYLHQAAIFKSLGYEVECIDVPEIQDLPFVVERANRFSIKQYACSNLHKGDFLSEVEQGSFGVILFTEILEHVTFNPIKFWQRIYELLKPGGIIYISTPNSLRWVNLISVIKRLLCSDGIGIEVNAIFDTITYGHHWKEYSSGEIIRYFERLSPDFSTSVIPYSYRQYDDQNASMKGRLRALLRSFGNRTGCGAEELKVIVKLNSKTRWDGHTKSYGEE